VDDPNGSGGTSRRAISAETLRGILREIRSGVSLNRAAGLVGISWRHAWEIVHRADGLLGVRLLKTSVGGRGGGGSSLTPIGECVLKELDRAQSSINAAFRAPHGTPPVLYVAATLESVETGLLDVVTAAFRRDRGGMLGVVAAGRGTALELARDGAVDLALTHAPELERSFVENGILESGMPIMESRYVIVGPDTDPADVRAATSRNDPVEAIGRIARAAAPFLSRGDNSGTHVRERVLWRSAGIEPEAPWYRTATEYGNRAVLTEAAERGAYALVDQATTRQWPLGTRQAILFGESRSRGNGKMVDQFSMFRVGQGRGPAGGAGYHRAGDFLSWFAEKRETLVRIGAVDAEGVALFEPFSAFGAS